MYLRFVTTRIDSDSHKPKGVFVASYELLDSGSLTRDEWKQVREILDWFNAHLPHPPKNFTTGRAIFWFKSSAEESIGKVWELVHMLREYGHFVEVYKCRRLANVIYSDELQVAAFPSREDARITVH
jgi:hypothetical protein